MVEESDEDMEETNEPQPQTFDEEDEGEIIESDVELEGETVEGDNDPPQKVLFTQIGPFNNYGFEITSI